MAKSLTTKINELKRKIAKAESMAISHLEKAAKKPIRKGHDKNYWHYMADGSHETAQKLKAQLCDLLLEYVAELEAERIELWKAHR